jgi:hypothetical protein
VKIKLDIEFLHSLETTHYTPPIHKEFELPEVNVKEDAYGVGQYYDTGEWSFEDDMSVEEYWKGILAQLAMITFLEGRE